MRNYHFAGSFYCDPNGKAYLHVIAGKDLYTSPTIRVTIHEVLHLKRTEITENSCVSSPEQEKLKSFLQSIPSSDLKYGRLVFPTDDGKNWADYYAQLYGEENRASIATVESAPFLATYMFEYIH